MFDERKSRRFALRTKTDEHSNWSAQNSIGRTAQISFAKDTLTQPGVNPVKLTTLDAAGGTDASTIQTSVNNAGAPAWIWDQVGNFSYGMTQGYAFDAENRFAQLDIYSPVQSTTYYSHDALGRCVSIAVWQNGIQITQKIYVWSGNKIIQELDSNGNVIKNNYTNGEIRSGTALFYTHDILGSVEELVGTSGDVRAQYYYDAFGEAVKLAGDFDLLPIICTK